MPLTLPRGRRFVPVGSGSTLYAYDDASPPTDAATDDAAYSMGLTFFVTASAQCTKILFWQPTANSPSTATRTGALWRVGGDPSTGTNLSGEQTFPATVSGWNTLTLSSPVALTANQQYRAVVLHPAGRYAATPNYFSSGAGSTSLVKGILTVPNNVSTLGTDQGSFIAGSTMAYPNTSFQATNYWIDVGVAAT